jgi:hypothetical protein
MYFTKHYMHMESKNVNSAEKIARAFHQSYENLAAANGDDYDSCPWEELPSYDKDALIAIVVDLLQNGIIKEGDLL